MAGIRAKGDREDSTITREVRTFLGTDSPPEPESPADDDRSEGPGGVSEH